MSSNAASSSTPPPALSWLHLLPGNCRLICEDCPEWLRAACSAYSGNGSAIHVTCNASDESDARLLNDRSAAGVVAINSRRLPSYALAASGFTYVRRFAAIPNLRQTRWLIPLDSPAISSAAFSLYTPARASAKLKRWAVRLATHTRLPFWYRDNVCIAMREAPPIEKALCGLFPKQEVRIALSSGAPEGARNRKASALVIGKNGELLAFVKLARSPIARDILVNEAQVLPKLSHLPVPRLLLNAEIDDTLVLAQTPLQGKPAPIPFGDAHRHFLRSLQTQERKPAAEVGMIGRLKQRLDELVHADADLADVLDQVLPVLESFTVPVTVVHGDFAPWNLRLHEGQISAFDWEYAELSGLPLLDEIHYRLQVGMMLENWDAFGGARCLRELADSRPMDLEPAQVTALATVYLLDALARLLGEGYGADHEMIVWHRDLLMQIAPRPAAEAEKVVAA